MKNVSAESEICSIHLHTTDNAISNIAKIKVCNKVKLLTVLKSTKKNLSKHSTDCLVIDFLSNLLIY